MLDNRSVAFVFEGPIDLSGSSAWAAGKVLASDAELFAIRNAVLKGSSLEDCDRIVIFTDSIAMAKRAVDPSVHSGQAHSLTVCRKLAAWLSGFPDRKVMFVEVPSKLEWGIQHQAHLRARSLPPIVLGERPETSLDGVRKHVADSAWMRGPLWPATLTISDTSSWCSATPRGSLFVPRTPMAVRGYVMSTRTTYFVRGSPEWFSIMPR